jgi:hypothetical protein
VQIPTKKANILPLIDSDPVDGGLLNMANLFRCALLCAVLALSLLGTQYRLRNGVTVCVGGDGLVPFFILSPQAVIMKLSHNHPHTRLGARAYERVCRTDCQAAAFISQQGVTGTVEFARFTATQVALSIELNGVTPPTSGLLLRINTLPVSEASPTISVCSRQSLGPMYDPFGRLAAANYSVLCAQTRDNCAVGDLSGKYGTFPSSQCGTNCLSEVDSSTRLPLTGTLSLIGRSVVVLRASGEVLACATIVRTADRAPAPLTTLVASFKYSAFVRGAIVLQHPRVSPSATIPAGQTTLLATLGQRAALASPLNLSWFISLSSPGADAFADSLRCRSAGSLWNPGGAPTTSSAACSPGSSGTNVLTAQDCPVGDIAARVGLAAVGAVSTLSRTFATDPLLTSSTNNTLTVASRGLVLASGTAGFRLDCTEIRPVPPRLARARFDGPGVQGVADLSQPDPTSPTSVQLSLRFTLPVLQAAEYSYFISETDPIMQPPDCQVAGPLFNPFNVPSNSSACNLSSTADQCALGALSARQGSLTPDLVTGAANITFLDPSIPLSGPLSVVDRGLVIVDATGTRIACARIEALASRTVIATFSSPLSSSLHSAPTARTISGQVVFQQASPSSATTLSVSLQGLGGRAAGLAIVEGTCGEPGGLWAPTAVNLSLCGSVLNASACVVGNLSARWGTLLAQEAVSWSLTDPLIQLYGSSAPFGLALVVVTSVSSLPTAMSILACAPIGFAQEYDSMAVLFAGPVAGQMTFRQPRGAPLQDTLIRSSLGFAATGAPLVSLPGSWLVSPDSCDLTTGVTLSAAALPTFNSLGTCTLPACNYSSVCGPFQLQTGCMIGDLTSKHGLVPVGGSNAARATLTDTLLPLTGANTISNLSLSISTAPSSPAACARVVPRSPRIVTITLICRSSNVSGTITLSQADDVSPTFVRVQISGLSTSGALLQIRELPETPPRQSEPRCLNVGGVYNPFNASAACPAPADCPAGDLSGRWGPLSSEASSSSQLWEDSYLSLWGPASVLGRSIALGLLDVNGSVTSWICADIGYPGPVTRLVARLQGTVMGQVS